MSKPISHRELIRRMRALGWQGPEPGRRHKVMRKGEHTVPIPNPHGGDIDWPLTKRILAEAEISPQNWERL
jgi:hypothetical protein